jgi:hypothetical protein
VGSVYYSVFPKRPEHPRGRIEKIISEMNHERTWQRLSRILILISLCILGLAIVDNASAQQQQPTVRGKSKGAVPGEDVASLLREAASLLQAASSTKPSLWCVARWPQRHPMLTRIIYSA